MRLLLTGRPGTGKTTLIRATHERPKKSNAPVFVLFCF
ncbi:MAG: AAA family ATPase [Deltaproteobacteria bacterium]|nr:AAA family ATPase [Deltaproteobacteria bacterium]